MTAAQLSAIVAVTLLAIAWMKALENPTKSNVLGAARATLPFL